MTERETENTFGRLDVSVPDQAFEAGKAGTISILIKNPFNVPIEIIEVVGPKSPHLIDNDDEITPERTHKKSAWEFFKSRMGLIDYRVGVAGVEFQFHRADPGRKITINADPNSTLTVVRDFSPYDNVKINAAEGSNVTVAPPEDSTTIRGEQIQRVEPHCDTVMYVTVSTRSWLFFEPTILNLNSQLIYRIGGEEKTQVISTSISVKPPIKAMVVGAVLGGALGSLAKTLQSANALEFTSAMISLGSASVMSLIAAIALSRRSGSQGFITVEDFYGGFAVGALIGYSGSEYFEQAILPNNAN